MKFSKALLATALAPSALYAADKPNILFFLVDDMGTQDTSVPFHYQNGQPVTTALNSLYRTPNMERLARDGRKFTNAYSYSVCSPTRVSLMNGQSAVRHGVTNWTHPKISQDVGQVASGGVKSPQWTWTGLDLSLPTLPGLLKNAGYTTLFAGKAHFGPDDTLAGNPLTVASMSTLQDMAVADQEVILVYITIPQSGVEGAVIGMFPVWISIMGLILSCPKPLPLR